VAGYGARAQPAILKALGISVPPSMQARADEMIE
jgi:hypothetical protein